MKLKVKKSKSSKWGFVEKFDTKYSYMGVQFVKVIVALKFNSSGECSAIPYTYRGEEFVPLSELGFPIQDFVKAKKPVYSLLDGIIVSAVLKYDSDLNAHLNRETSSVELYQPILEEYDGTYIPCRKLVGVSNVAKIKVVEGLYNIFETQYLSRTSVLKARLEGYKDETN